MRKPIDTLVLASITSGISMVEDFGEVHDAFNFIIGFSLYTHELPLYRLLATDFILAEHPDLPTCKPDDWKATATALIAKHGVSLDMPRGKWVREQSAYDTLDTVMTAEIAARQKLKN